MTAIKVHHTLESHSVDATVSLGDALGRALCGGVSIGIVGPLGAGKTHLVKGIAAGNGAADPRKITSPTFTLINEYPGRFRLYHIDVYRLRGPSELIALGFEELASGESAVAVEWADRVRSAMPTDTLWIEITLLNDTGRRFMFEAGGPSAQQCLNALRAQTL